MHVLKLTISIGKSRKTPNAESKAMCFYSKMSRPYLQNVSNLPTVNFYGAMKMASHV